MRAVDPLITDNATPIDDDANVDDEDDDDDGHDADDEEEEEVADGVEMNDAFTPTQPTPPSSWGTPAVGAAITIPLPHQHYNDLLTHIA